MEDTTIKPINITEIELRGILDKIAEAQLDDDPESTTMPALPTEYDSTTSCHSNNPPIAIKFGYNRRVSRFAKKHGITEEEAFKRLYK
jgi:hypothetical protein